MDRPEHVKHISDFLFFHQRNMFFIYLSMFFVLVYEITVTVCIFHDLINRDFRINNLFSFFPVLIPLSLFIFSFFSSKKVKKISALKIDIKQITEEEIEVFFPDNKVKLRKLKSSLFKEKRM